MLTQIFKVELEFKKAQNFIDVSRSDIPAGGQAEQLYIQGLISSVHLLQPIISKSLTI
jgi:hypothetical protein